MKRSLFGIAALAAMLFGQPTSGRADQVTFPHYSGIEVGTVDSYTVVGRAHETTTVSVKGVGSSDLDLRVYDENGNLIAEDTDGTDYCLVSWTPSWTGTFVVRVSNEGRARNLYRIARY